MLRGEVSDLIIAPGFEPEALEILKDQEATAPTWSSQIDPDYEPPTIETREVFGFTPGAEAQQRARSRRELFRQGVAGADAAPLPDDVLETLIVATVALKYTQSNSVCVAYDGQVIGMGAGQQSRVHCTRLACGKADKWLLQQHPKTLALPFREDLPRSPRRPTWSTTTCSGTSSRTPRSASCASGLTADPEPLTREERADWVAAVRRHLPVSDAFIPFRDNLDRAGREQRAVRRPDRRLGARRRRERRRRRVRHDDGAHRPAAVPALGTRHAERLVVDERTHEVTGLPLIAAPDARVLVLGSAPSVLSLQRQEYYGNPRNAFWPLMAELLRRPAGEDYAARTRMLVEARIALWDVLASAERPGSLDASIVATTAVVNDFEAFFAGHPQVRAVFFNGRTARSFWDRRVEGRQALPAGLALTTLPSTSPAGCEDHIRQGQQPAPGLRGDVRQG